MSKQISNWYLNRLDEVPNLEYEVKKKDPTLLVISTQIPGLPELLSVNVNLTGGFVTFESPVNVGLKRNSLKLLGLSAELWSYLSVIELGDKLLPVICMDRRVGRDFKIDKTNFHRDLSHFLKDCQVVSQYFDDHQSKSKAASSKEYKPQNVDMEDKDKQVGFQPGKVNS